MPHPTRSTPLHTRVSRLRIHATLLLLLTAAVCFVTWHYRQGSGRLSDAAEPTAHSNPARAAVPEASVGGAIHTATGSVAGSTPSANVRIATHPEEGPAWAVPYGQEFWRSSAPPSAPPKGDTNPAPSFNIGEVVERVSHAFTPGDAGELPHMQARTYTARFDEAAGLGFSPHRPMANQAVVANAANVGVDNAQADEGQSRRSRRRAAVGPAARPQPDPGIEAWFRTIAVGRDGQALFTAGQDTPQWSLLGNTVQGLLNPAVGLVVHYEARRDGMELTWMLPQAPAGTGPLLVEAELNGLTYAGQTEHGLHYADVASVARVRVGSVTVVDAAGGRWNLAMAAAGNRLRLEVPTDILDRATYPLAIDPALEAEFEIDKPVIAPAGDEQNTPALAGDNSGYLVVWYDSRIGRIGGARVTKGGQLLDPLGIFIETTSFASSDPAVAASSSGYLVVWDVQRTDMNHDVYGARVTTDGVVSDVNGILICTNASSQPLPSVAANGREYLVVWGDERNSATTGYDIYGARVTTDGVVSDLNGFAISTAENAQLSPAVAASGSGYLVVWEDSRNIATTSRDIYGARVTATGVVSDTNGIAICTNGAFQIAGSVAATSSGYLVVWQDDRNAMTTSIDIYGARVTTAGVVSDPNGLAICTNSASQTLPAVAANGGGYLVVWTDNRTGALPGLHIFGARVTTAGAVSDRNGIAISTAANNQLSPAVAANSSGYLVVWEDERNIATTGHDIYGARVTTAGVVSDTNGIVISTAANSSSFAAVAAGSNGYLVVWEDDRNSGTTGTDVYGARVTRAGVVSDPNGITISTATEDQYSLSVAAGSNTYLVVWQDSRDFANTSVDIYGARVTTAGVLLDTNGIAICTSTNSQASASVAGSSSGYLVVWADARNVVNTSVDIYGARVTTTGIVLDTNGLAVCTAIGGQFSPAVAASSNTYLVVWSDERNTSFSDIYGARVTMAGVVSDPTGIAISTAIRSQISPAVAANSDGYLVVWTDVRNDDLDIYGARVTTAGVVDDPAGIPICTLFGGQQDPSVAAAGEGYVVVWVDLSSNSLFWHRLNPAGQLLESAPLAINGSYQRKNAALAYGGAGRFLLTSDRVRGPGIAPVSRVIGSLHATNRSPAGLVIELKAAGFTVIEDKAAATITVTATGNNPGIVTADYATANGTAQDGTDYEGQSGTLVFPQGIKQQTFTIPIPTNTTHEADVTVNLVLSNPGGGATLGLKRRAVLTIVDDDAGGAISLSAAAYSVRESTHILIITVKRTGGTASGVTVAYETSGGTAVAGTDYTAQADTLSFAAGELSKTFTIPILDNLIKEAKKTFFVHLFNPTGGATLGPVAAATVTILDDD